MICIHSSQIRGPKREQVIRFNGKVERVRIEKQPYEKQLWTLWEMSEDLESMI